MDRPQLLSMVQCPEDRGDKPYVGKVMEVGDEIHLNHKGDPYRWTTIRDERGAKHIWPSNRLNPVA